MQTPAEKIFYWVFTVSGNTGTGRAENCEPEAGPNCGVNPRTKLLKRYVWRVHQKELVDAWD